MPMLLLLRFLRVLRVSAMLKLELCDQPSLDADALISLAPARETVTEPGV